MTDLYTQVHPQELYDRAAQFGTVAEQAAHIGQSLQAAIAGVGDCWGSDEIGTAFLKQYEPQRSALVAGVEGIAPVARGVGSGLQTMAAGYQRAENAANQIVY